MRIQNLISVFQSYNINSKLIGSYVVGLVEKREFYLESNKFKGTLTYLIDGDIRDLECNFNFQSMIISRLMIENRTKQINIKNISLLNHDNNLSFLLDTCYYFNLTSKNDSIEVHLNLGSNSLTIEELVKNGLNFITLVSNKT